MRICITRSQKHAYSETFIRAQIKILSELSNVFSIYGGRFPERKEDGSLLNPQLFWMAHKILKIFLGRNNFFSNYGVKRHLKENKVDVVLANYGLSASHMVPPCKTLNIPLLVIFHGHDASDKKLLREYRKKYQKLFAYASFIIAVSEEMKKNLIAIGATSSKIRVIPCGVDTLKFRPNKNPHKEKRLLAVGRFTAKKGPLYTIKAFHKVLQKFPKATLTMVGKKTGLYDDCEQLVKELKIHKSVIFTGVLEQNRISDLMKASTAFVQHSITAPNGDMEGSPVSIAEASASGLPVVSSLHGGIKNLVLHEKTGFLVEETDIDAMANYIIKIFEDANNAKEMGHKGRKHVEENYNQKKQLLKLYALAQKAINNN
ncbi:glycosyltransferase family 4 protein [Flagellimonas hymeniacidonis]|uniref:Glycosyltransferase family 4 protein n=1 Tax=Flagellimonas hymeniacidonis TaxID=2603628 RepID=A0A5C8V9Z2_9FLAO|nr:glycosyltransferase family 4 protein [Flagellimonas hymeniacidonis]TXN38183.1 glycosyltransferase family 4 protein [Flagellimonas hymeniacidonis]